MIGFHNLFVILLNIFRVHLSILIYFSLPAIAAFATS
jgi:hypothetical protein